MLWKPRDLCYRDRNNVMEASGHQERKQDTIVSQFSPIHILTNCFSKIRFNIILPFSD